MSISFPFLLFARPALEALRWVRVDLAPPLADLPAGEAGRARLEQQLAKRFPPHLKRDVLRDE